MGVIAVCTNPFNQRDIEYHGHSGPYIDWLREHYPHGFNAAHKSFFNDDYLRVDDYDRVIGEHDIVGLAIAPHGGVGMFLATVALSVAFQFISTALFGGPKDPAKIDEPSAIYNISSRQNVARLGEPIPAVYGDGVMTFPNVGSQPWKYFRSNEQYLAMYLVLGQGNIQVNDVYVEDTPVDQLPTGLFEYTVFLPAAHNTVLGTMEATTDHHENVVTSIEVGGIELTDELAGSAYHVPIEFDATLNALVFNSGIPTALSVGDQIVVSEGGNNDGTYTINAIDRDTDTVYVNESITDPTGQTQTLLTATTSNANGTITAPLSTNTLTISGSNMIGLEVNAVIGALDFNSRITGYSTDATNHIFTLDTVPAPDQTSLTCTLTFPQDGLMYPDLDITYSDWWVGPFNACGASQVTDKIQIDIEWPNGLYDLESGGTEVGSQSVQMQFEIEQIDSNGDPVGPAIVYDEEFWGHGPNPYRYTYEYDVPEGRYRVRARKTFANTNAVADRTVWVGLKAFIPYATYGSAYGDVTMMFVLMRASNGLSSQGQNRVRVDCSRLLTPYGGGAEQVTENPADIFNDIITNQTYGAARPSDEVDSTTLTSAQTDWAALTGFNGVFDTKTTVWAALESSIALMKAKPILIGKEIAILQDEAKTTVQYLFTPDNVTPDSLVINYLLDSENDIDGYKVEYRDDFTVNPLYTTYPTDAARPQQVSLFGCTDETQASEYAQYLWHKKLYRRKYIEFETELEGHIPQVGDLIGVAVPIYDWSEHATVVAVSGTTLTLDRDIVVGGSGMVMLRDEDGSASSAISVSQGAANNIIVLGAAAPFTIHPVGGGQEPTLVAYANQTTVTDDYIVTAVEPGA